MQRVQQGKRNILVTSALPYVNNVPHLGNIIGCVLSADVYARFARLRGYNVLYVCGTDEYGTATEAKAQEEGLSPRQICDKYHALHASIYKWFDISFDQFGRTSTPMQTEIAQSIFHQCQKQGYVLEKEVDQLHCTECDKFLADRFVLGTCPHDDCKYDDARGDQCDLCGRLLNATELVNPRCSTHGTLPLLRTSKHLFLDLPALSNKLGQFIETQSVKGDWSSNSTTVSQSWLSRGLEPRCITRDLKWGTPVPFKGFEDKVFYVWFDAPIGYISITAAYSPEHWKEWWQSKDVELYQFMGKDNIPFHTVIFPATLMASGQPWTMLKHINTTEYLNYETGKFSKSRGVGVFGDSVQESGIPSDVWRYYLLASRPESSDAVFSWDDFAVKNNTELLNNLGNFVNRALKFVKQKYDGVVPAYVLAEEHHRFFNEVDAMTKQYIAELEDVKIKAGLRTLMHLSQMGNQFLQTHKPWKLIGDENTKVQAQTVTAIALNLAYLLATLAEPYMPALTSRILAQMNVNKPLSLDNTATFGMSLGEGHTIGAVEPLFSKITTDQVKEFRAKYSGQAGEAAGGEPFPLALVVAQIAEVQQHPSAEHLFVLKLKTADPDLRTVVSGLVGHYSSDELIGKRVLYLANLKAANFRGVKSFGMVLCAKSGDTTSLLVPTDTAQVGDAVGPAGMNTTLKQDILNTKKFKSVFSKLKFQLNEQGHVSSAHGDLVTLSGAAYRCEKPVDASTTIQ